MTLTLSSDQSRAADAVGAWLKSRPSPSFTLHGAAGSGKTSLAKHLASLQSGRVLFAAYSGKAAAVLRSKGCLPASTIHSLVYSPISERNDEIETLRAELTTANDARKRVITARIAKLQEPKFIVRPREKTPLADAALLVLDECSMIDAQMAQDILSFNVPVLVLGDPYQLPPIEGAGYFDAKCDFLLTEIHRQAAESPVIHLATMAREGRRMSVGRYGTSEITMRAKTSTEQLLAASQVLSCSNKGRVNLNKQMRAAAGFEGPYPRAGERLICLRNNPQSALLNGDQITLTEDARDSEADESMLELVAGETKYTAHRACFDDPQSLRAMPWWRRVKADEFDFASCITVHKSQGSQWESVFVWEDSWKWDAEMLKRSRYTALSRAEDRVTLAL